MPDTQRRKLDKKAKRLRFVGYSTKSKGYRFFDEITPSCKVFVRDVLFNEVDFNHKGGEKAIESKPSINVGSRSDEMNGQ